MTVLVVPLANFFALNELPTRLVEVSFFCFLALVMDVNFHILPIFAQVELKVCSLTSVFFRLSAFEKPSGNRNWPFTLPPIQIGGIEPTFNFKKVLKIAKYCFWKGAFDNSLALDPKCACHVSLLDLLSLMGDKKSLEVVCLLEQGCQLSHCPEQTYVSLRT